MHRYVNGSVGAIVAAVLLAGCGSSAQPIAPEAEATPRSVRIGSIVHTDDGEPALPPGLPSASGDATKAPVLNASGGVLRPDGSVTFPLDAYQRVENQKTVTKAVNLLAGTCMRAQGLEYPVQVHDVPRVRIIDSSNLYGVVDLDSAKVNGYRTTGSKAMARAGIVNSETGNSRPPTPQEITAARGRGGRAPLAGEDGCIGAARRQLNGAQLDALGHFLLELTLEADSRSRNDSRAKKATDAWRACMKSAGFNYADPTEPGHDKTMLGKGLPIPPGAQLPPPSPFEINVAVTDIGCKRTSSYLETVVAVTTAYQNQLIEKNAQQLHQNDETWAQILQEANKTLSAR
ncbi:hypothetical protein [Streptomyces sp. NPDC054863]